MILETVHELKEFGTDGPSDVLLQFDVYLVEVLLIVFPVLAGDIERRVQSEQDLALFLVLRHLDEDIRLGEADRNRYVDLILAFDLLVGTDDLSDVVQYIGGARPNIGLVVHVDPLVDVLYLKWIHQIDYSGCQGYERVEIQRHHLGCR